MIYRSLGTSGLQVSALTLGSMMFGEQTSAQDSLRIIASARDQGVNFIDTADVYNQGRSETLVGQGVAAHRQDWIVASKVGMGPSDGAPNRRGLSRKHLFNALDASLARLGSDYLDIYYLHRDDPSVPLETVVATLGDFLRAGKIRYWGVSNFRGWRIAELVNLAKRMGVDQPIISQPLYNIVNRQAEIEQITAAHYHGLGVVPYSPLARGVLTGKYTDLGHPADDSRAGRQDKRILETEWRPESLQIAAQLQAYVAQRGTDLVAFAIAWVLHNAAVSSAIVGPRTLEQWQAYGKALDVTLTAEDEAFVDRLVTPGHASTHGFNDVGHFISGRLLRS